MKILAHALIIGFAAIAAIATPAVADVRIIDDGGDLPCVQAWEIINWSAVLSAAAPKIPIDIVMIGTLPVSRHEEWRARYLNAQLRDSIILGRIPIMITCDRRGWDMDTQNQNLPPGIEFEVINWRVHPLPGKPGVYVLWPRINRGNFPF